MNLVIRAIASILLGLLVWGFASPALSNVDKVADFEQGSHIPPEGWELVVTAGEADLTYAEGRGEQCLRFHSNESSFGIQKEIDIDLAKTPYLVWDWKVTKIPHDGHFKISSKDDQAAQLIFSFSEDFFGTHEVLSYIWGSSVPSETMGNAAAADDIPFLEIKAVVVESGPEKLGRWITESRNIVEDYKQLYGEEPTRITGVRIQINSQHTDAVAESFWRTIRFQSHPPSASHP